MKIPTIYAPTAIESVRSMLENYIIAQMTEGVQFLPGDLIQCVWMWFKISEEGGNEVLAPRFGAMPMEFQRDCSEALNLILTQRYICDSFSVDMELCHARQSVIAVKDIADCSEIFISREESTAEHSSGWFIGGQDSKSDVNNPEDLELKSMWEIGCMFPALWDFFLLPYNWQVVLEDKPVVLKDYEKVLPLKQSYYERKYALLI